MRIFTMFSPGYINAVVYMLQSTEYQIKPYLKWFWRTSDFKRIMKRRQLEKTKAARLLALTLRIGISLQIVASVYLILNNHFIFGMLLLITYPLLWAHLVIVPLGLGRIFVINPQEKRLIEESKTIFSSHMATKIAVAGSYGKTSMKELLATILAKGKRVAVTPANKNVASSHAIFARQLDGDEEILIIEYGEGRPGDVARFAATTQPDIGIITGIAPAHLDQYKNMDAAAKDIFGLADYLNDHDIYVNGDSDIARPYIKPSHKVYSSSGIEEWKVSNVTVKYDGLEFNLSKNKQKLALKSQLIGRHQVGPLALAAALAYKLGLTAKQIEEGVASTKPFDHRMQSRRLNGAWIIDDTYNGNIDGIKAGLRLLTDLPAKRKVYVTPGLVDQGIETEPIHIKMGELIADANPDKVVLMHNSVTKFINDGLLNGKYKGQVQIEEDPLAFYSNLSHFIAAGDLVLMQNDWTDNYS